MGDLTAHFSRSEFREHDNGALPPGVPTYALLTALEALRAECGGRPLRIVSGYRSPAYNASVGGAPDSRHIHGDAADIPEGYCTVAQAEAAGFAGIGTGKTGTPVHLDVRPGPRVIFVDHQ